MNIIIDILIVSFIGVLYSQRAGGSPESLPSNSVCVYMYFDSHYVASIAEGLYDQNGRLMTYWMHGGQYLSEEIDIYILLDSGAHFEGSIDLSNVDSRVWPTRPRTAELHIARNGVHEYFTTGTFGWHDVRRRPSETENPPVSYIYVRMTSSIIFKAVLTTSNSEDKQQTPKIQENGVGTSQKRRRVRTSG